MTDGALIVAGEEVQALPQGALWWPSMRLLAVADLHLEKGSAYGVRGQFLPPYDTRETLARLSALCANLKPDIVIALGDSFHDRDGPERLPAEDRACLQGLTASCDWIWVTGNHDGDRAGICGGQSTDELALGRLIFRHEPQTRGAAGEIAGHLHPKARVTVKGRTMSRPCFVSNSQRIVLPAFGAFTGGLDVWNPAFRPLFRQGFQVLLLGRERVFAFTHERLAG